MYRRKFQPKTIIINGHHIRTPDDQQNIYVAAIPDNRQEKWIMKIKNVLFLLPCHINISKGGRKFGAHCDLQVKFTKT